MKRENIRGWQVNVKRPPNGKEFLYDIEIHTEERTTGVVRDCRYENNVFTQIDDKTEFSRFEIISWKRKTE